MELNLIDRGNHVRAVKQATQVMRLEVRDAYRTDPVIRIEALERTPGFEVMVTDWCRPVDEVQILLE